MKLIVGLGNPGNEYRKTRHNAGFMVVDQLATRYSLGPARMQFHAGVIDGMIAGEKVLLMQPTTYMNRSGQAVIEAMNFYKLESSDLLVVVDDVAIDLGRLRLRARGSAGGHNGLSDIANRIGTSEYPRLRFGVGQAPGQVAQRDWVLSKFREDEQDELAVTIERAADCCVAWLREPIELVMTKFNALD